MVPSLTAQEEDTASHFPDKQCTQGPKETLCKQMGSISFPPRLERKEDTVLLL
jgi:hypothetical protein